MKYSTEFKRLAAFAGITTLIGLGLIGATIGLAVHSMATNTAILLPTLTTGTTSQVPMAIASTTTLAIGLMATFFLLAGRETKDNDITFDLDGAIMIGIIAGIISTAVVMGLGYGAGHLGIATTVASSYSGFALLGVEAACGAGMATILPLIGALFMLYRHGLNDGSRPWVSATVTAAVAGAGSALAGPAFASIVGAIGSEAIAIECMTALALSMIPAIAFGMTIYIQNLPLTAQIAPTART